MREPRKLEPIQKNYLWGTEDWMFSKLQEGLENIPLLVKIIRAKEALSVQVHPDDGYAMIQEQSSGKTEMWYVIDCEPDAYLYYGLKHKISPKEFQKRIQNDSILEVCRKVPVRKGDVFFIPAGMLHGIGKGITVAEVQQSSNITYRVYDYHRVDAQQKQRPLHIEKASQVLGFLPSLQGHGPMGPKICGEGYERTLLIRCPYFTVYRYEICSKMDCPKAEQEQSLLVLEGEGILTTSHQEMNLKKGDSIYLPAGTNSYTLTGNMQILLSEVEV